MSMQGFLFVCLKQDRDVNEMSTDPCVLILARISNPQVVKMVNKAFSNGKPEEKIAANEPKKHVSSVHLSEQNSRNIFLLSIGSKAGISFLSPPVPF